MAEKKHSPTYAIIIVTYIVIVVLFTVLMGAAFLYSAETLTEQIRQTDAFTAERIMQQAGRDLRNLFDHGEMLVQDDRLAAFIKLPAMLQRAAGAEVGRIMDRANDFTNLTKELFLCPAGPDSILNKSGLHEGEDLAEMLQSMLGISPEEWRERASFQGPRSFQVVTASDDTGKVIPRFLMMVRRPGDENNAQGCFVAGIVPAEMLNDIAVAVRPDGYEDIIAECPEGIYSFRRQSMITPEELEKESRSGKGLAPLLFSKKPVHAAIVGGKIEDWTCRVHFFCPMAPYRRIVLVCLRNFVVSVLIALLLGSVLLYFTLSRQYRPLRILLDRISGRRKESDPALRGEYRMLDQAIGALQEKQQGTESRLAEYRTRLQETAAHQLLHGTDVREESLIAFFRQHEMDLHSEQCRVLLLALDADGFMEGLSEKEESATLDRLLKMLQDTLYQCVPNSCCVITDDCVECLFCGGEDTDGTAMLQSVRNSLMEVCRRIGAHFYAAVSRQERGTEGARRAFLQAEAILDHATMSGLRDMILEEPPEQHPVRNKSDRSPRNQQLLDYVNAHYADPALSVLQMADVFDMSPSSVSRTFRQSADTGLNTYINTLRVARAKELIETTADSMKSISETVGYGNQITMIRAFKRLEGVTPQEYRDRIRGETR